MIKVKSEVRIQEIDGAKLNAIGAPTITVESHLLWNHLVILNFGNSKLTVVAQDLIQAASDARSTAK